MLAAGAIAGRHALLEREDGKKLNESGKQAESVAVVEWRRKDGAGVVGFVGSGCLIFALCGVLKSDNYNIIITLSKSGAWYIKSLTFLKLKEQSTTWSESKGGGRGRGG